MFNMLIREKLENIEKVKENRIIYLRLFAVGHSL